MTLTESLTVERLRELLDYNPETGVFVWRASRGKAKVGSRAGKMRGSGRLITIDGVTHMAARLAWLYIHGELPVRRRLIRFADGNQDNAAITNLTLGTNDFTTQDGKNAYAKVWRKANPRNQRHIVLKRSYGLTVEQYQQMLLDQKGVCACCYRPETAVQKGRIMPLSVDHCHVTHTVRGLLCTACNHMLGNAEDSETTLVNAIEYLRFHRAKPKTNVIPLSGRRISGSKGN